MPQSLVISPPPLDVYSQGAEAVRQWWERQARGEVGQAYVVNTPQYYDKSGQPVSAAPEAAAKAGLSTTPVQAQQPQAAPQQSVFYNALGQPVSAAPEAAAKANLSPTPQVAKPEAPPINLAMPYISAPPVRSEQQTYTPNNYQLVEKPLTVRTTDQMGNVIDVRKSLFYGTNDPYAERAERIRTEVSYSPYGIVTGLAQNYGEAAKKLRVGKETGDITGQVVDILKTNTMLPPVSPAYQVIAGVAKQDYTRVARNIPFYSTGVQIGESVKTGDTTLAILGSATAAVSVGALAISGPKVGGGKSVSVGTGTYSEMAGLGTAELTVATRVKDLFGLRVRDYKSTVKTTFEIPQAETAISRGVSEITTNPIIEYQFPKGFSRLRPQILEPDVSVGSPTYTAQVNMAKLALKDTANIVKLRADVIAGATESTVGKLTQRYFFEPVKTTGIQPFAGMVSSRLLAEDVVQSAGSFITKGEGLASRSKIFTILRPKNAGEAVGEGSLSQITKYSPSAEPLAKSYAEAAIKDIQAKVTPKPIEVPFVAPIEVNTQVEAKTEASTFTMEPVSSTRLKLTSKVEPDVINELRTDTFTTTRQREVSNVLSMNRFTVMERTGRQEVTAQAQVPINVLREDINQVQKQRTDITQVIRQATDIKAPSITTAVPTPLFGIPPFPIERSGYELLTFRPRIGGQRAYFPSLIGLVSGKTTSRVPSTVLGEAIRLPYAPKKRKR